MLTDLFPPQKNRFQAALVAWLCLWCQGYEFPYRPRNRCCFAESCTLPVPWLSQLLWAHPVQEQQAPCCTYKWTGFDSYHWQERKKNMESAIMQLYLFSSSLNGCSLCICWQNHSVQNKSSSVTHQEHGNASLQGLREAVLGFGGELLLSN